MSRVVATVTLDCIAVPLDGAVVCTGRFAVQGKAARAD